MFTRSSGAPTRSITARVLSVLALVTALVVVLSVALAYETATAELERATAAKVTDVALVIAASDDVRRGLAAPSPAAALGDVAERWRAATGTDFVVVMSPAGVRYTHPTPELVGGRFAGSIAAAQAGATLVENYQGSLGPSTRAVVPVLQDGRVLGLVSVGVRRTRVETQLRDALPRVALPGLAAALASGAGALVVVRRVRSETLGLNAAELRRLQAQAHEASNRLHTVLTLIETGRADEAVALAAEASRTPQRDRDAIVAAVEEPAVAALLLTKAVRAGELGVRLTLDPDAHLPAGVLPARAAVTVLGNLIDNALDAVAELPQGAAREVVVDAQVTATEILLTVSDTGPGIAHPELAVQRGWTTKDSDRPAGRGLGLALVRQTVDDLGGTLLFGPPPGATIEVTVPRDGSR